MSLNGIMSSALSALQTSTSALDVVSSNISNMNTTGYAQRVVNEQTQAEGSQLSGVEIADIERVTDQFLTQQTLSAQSSSSLYSAQNNILSQINNFLGQVGSGSDLPSQLSDVFSALSSASTSSTSSASQQAVLTALNNFASTVSNLSSSITGVQNQADEQVVSDVGSVNGYLQQIYQLNQEIEASQAADGGAASSSGLLDQRDQIVQSLSQLIGVSTTTTASGAMLVSTTDGVNLVGTSTYAQLSCAGGSSNGTYAPVTMQSINALTGLPVGASQSINADLGSGEIAGLIQMRDGTLSQLQQQLGNFAQQAASAFNAQYNANASFPPPTSLTGSDTGLLSSDALNFTGQTTIAVTDSSGNLVSQVNVDFDTGTLSVDGGASQSIGSTIGSFVSALDSALGSNGSASFNNGQLSISATGGNGIVIQDDASDPSSRGGTGFSQFFGLNDLFTSAAPSITATGLSSTDVGDFSGTINLQLTGPSGQTGPTASVTLTPGMTIGDVVNALNSAFGSTASFSLSSNGSLTMTPGTGYPGYTLGVTSDTTQRGTTGVSLSELFGLGSQQTANAAVNFEVNPAIADGEQQLAFAEPQITSSTVAGDTVVDSGDNSGLLALQNLSNTQLTFPAAGGLNAQTTSLGNYADSFYQSVATTTQTVQTDNTAAADQLTQAQTQQSQVSGVNLDQQLSNMVLYQQAYGAGARVLQTANQLFSTLMGIQSS